MTDFAHSLALVIGINAYSNGIWPLTTAVNDATRLADLLRTAHGYETILLTEEAAGQPVTQEQLRLLFEELKGRLGEDDRLLFYFAGHGVALDGDDGPRGYLVPQDATPKDPASLLAMTDLHSWLTALPCRHMLAILDCCFAGAFRWSATRNIGALPDVIYRERYDRYLVSPAWQVLTSAAYDQKALDVLNGNTIGVRESNGRPHSPFALALFAALEKGDADLIPKNGGDGVITATELYLYLREQVEVQADTQANHEQTPGLWPLNRHRKGEFIFLVPGHALNLPPAPDLTAKANPYRGLKSYDQKHAELFFGRDAEIQALADRVDKQPFVAVLGASGTGKSSLVKAGVLPRLLATEGKVQAADPVFKVLTPFRPTDHPIQALASLLRAELGESLSGIADDNALARIVARWSESYPGQRLVLTIDQFEELVTLCQDHERKRFLGLLAAAVQEQPDAFRLIITLRTDFEPQFTRKEETEQGTLADLWPAARYVVPPMDIEDLRQVIEGPASVQVLYFDPPELVDDLIKEVIQTPGALPLLSFTLSELYVKYVQSGRDDRALSGVDYKTLGGVVGSLRNRATEEHDRLPDDAHRLTMQRVMLRMVAVEGSELARRRVAQSELDYPTQEENDRVKTVLDRLVEARLLVRGTAVHSDGTQGEAYVEPAHDALVLAWDMLLRWKKEADEYLPLQRRLTLAATEWYKAESKEKSGLLWSDDPRLPQVEAILWPTDSAQRGVRGRIRWAKQILMPKIDTPEDTKWINDTELAFVQTSVQHRASTLRKVFGIGLTVLIIVGALTSYGLNTQRTVATEKALKEEAQTARATAVAAQAESEAARVALTGLGQLDTDKERALMLTTTAAQNHRSWIEDSALRDVLASSGHTILLFTNLMKSSCPPYCYGDSPMVWSLTGDEILTIQDNQDVSATRITTGDQRLVLVGFQGGFNELLQQLQEVESGTWPETRSWPADNAQYFSPDRTRYVSSIVDWQDNSGKIDEKFQLRNGLDDSIICEQPSRLIDRAKPWSPTGEFFITGNGGIIRVWNGVTCEEIAHLTSDAGAITWAEWNSTGELIAGVSDSGHGRVWSLEPILEPKEIVDAGFRAWGVQAPHLLFTTTIDGEQFLKVWDADTQTEVVEMAIAVQSEPIADPFILNDTNDATIIYPVDNWDPAGTRNVLIFPPEVAQIWDAVNWKHQLDLVGHQALITDVDWSPSGDQVVTGSNDKTARIWDASTGELSFSLMGHGAAVTVVAWSPDGGRIATGAQDGTVRTWNAATGELLSELAGHTDAIHTLTWNPGAQSQLLLSTTSGNDGQAVRVLDLIDGMQIELPTLVLKPTWSATGAYLGGVTTEGAQVWSISDWSAPTRIGERRISWAPGTGAEDLVATQGENSSVLVWNLKTFTVTQRFLGHSGDVEDIEWNSKGDQLATTSADLMVRIWEMGNPLAVAVISVGSSPSWVRWSADDRHLVYFTQSSGVTVIYSQLSELIEITCENAVRNLSEGERQQYLGSLPLETVCPEAPKPGVDYPDPSIKGGRG